MGMPDSHSLPPADVSKMKVGACAAFPLTVANLSKTWSALLAERAAGGSGIWKVSSSVSLVCSLDLVFLGGGPSGSGGVGS